MMLMKSAVGTADEVFTSIGMRESSRISFRSKNGMRRPAFPINTFGFLLIPEIINALSGGAVKYELTKRMISKTTTTPPIITDTPGIKHLSRLENYATFLHDFQNSIRSIY